MIVLFKHRWNRIAVRISTASFGIGTLIMLTGLMATNDFINTLGLVFLAIYIPITLMMLFPLAVNAITHFKDIHEHVMTLIIVLINIPVALLYFNFLIN